MKGSGESDSTPQVSRKRRRASLEVSQDDKIKENTDGESDGGDCPSDAPPIVSDADVVAVQQGEMLTVITQNGDAKQSCMAYEHAFEEQIPRTEDIDLIRSKLALFKRDKLITLLLYAASRDEGLADLIDELSLADLCRGGEPEE